MRKAVVQRFITSQSWSSYWTNLISATVEDATPNEVVLTFSAANSATFEDFSMAGYQILSHYWNGNSLELTMGSDVIYGESLEINYTPSGELHAVINNCLSYNYVDTFSGNDTTGDGSYNNPWKTVTKADAVLSINAPLKLKLTNGYWIKAPVYWHTLKCLYMMFDDNITTKIYDIANGDTGLRSTYLTGSVTPLSGQTNGIEITPAGYVNFGEGKYPMGTGNMSIFVNVKKGTNNSSIHIIFSQGAFGTGAGYGVYINTNKVGFQMRSAGTNKTVLCTESEQSEYVFAASVTRNSATGLKIYRDGTIANSPGTDITALGTDDLSSSQNTCLGILYTGFQYGYDADAIKELRIYGSALGDTDVSVVSTEMTNNGNSNFKFTSGDYVGIGRGSGLGQNNPCLFQSKYKQGRFLRLIEATLTGNPAEAFGNAHILALNKDKCNNRITPQEGEINWLMTYGNSEIESPRNVLLAKSHNGINWEYVRMLPTISTYMLGEGDWFIDNDDPSDYRNIHKTVFAPAADGYGKIYETHPTTADFTEWSDLVELYSHEGDNKLYNPVVVKIGSNYHMIVSIEHYPYHLVCTHDPWTVDNDWTITQTGDWMGLGVAESFSIFSLGGNSWIMYYLHLGNIADPATFRNRYSISNDNLATWSTGVDIPELCPPTLQYAMGFTRLK